MFYMIPWFPESKPRVRRVNYYDASGTLTHFTIEKDITRFNWGWVIVIALLVILVILYGVYNSYHH